MPTRFEDQVSIQAGTAASHAATKGQLDAGVTDAKNRANHIGTQLADTISDLAAVIDARVQQVIDGAPGALDTLNELAAALGDDANFAATVSTQLSDLDTRLDVVETQPSGQRQYSGLVGNGSASSFSVAHNWGLADKNKVMAQVVDTGTGETVFCNVVRTDGNTVTVSFGSAVPAANQYRVLLSEITG